MNYNIVPADLADRMLREIERQAAEIKTLREVIEKAPCPFWTLGHCRNKSDACDVPSCWKSRPLAQMSHLGAVVQTNIISTLGENSGGLGTEAATLPEASTLGQRLREISDKALASGTKVLSADEISEYVAEIRGASIQGQGPKEWRIAYECYSDATKRFQFEAVSLPSEAECDAWQSHLLPIKTNNIRKQWRTALGPWQDAQEPH